MLLEIDPVGDWDSVYAQMLPWIIQRYPAWEGWPRGHHYLREYAWLFERIGNPAGKYILDAGGGGSVISAVLYNAGAQVVVADRLPNPYTSKVTALTCGLRDVGVALADANLEDDFDIIVAASSIEHNEWQDQIDIFDALLRTLKPNGRLLVTLPAAKTTDVAWHKNLNNWGPVHFWTHDSARRMAYVFDDVAELKTPLLSNVEYDTALARIHDEVVKATPSLGIYPYQSLVLEWQKK